MADLLPCPFCTSKSIEVEIIQNDCAWVECPACLSRGPEEATPERAAEAWNARTEVITNEPQGAWQPFETAPKVGTFLVYMPEEHRELQVMYRTERMAVVGGAFAFDMSKPTHWMPAPDTSALTRPHRGSAE